MAKLHNCALSLAALAAAGLLVASNVLAQPYQTEINRWNAQDAIDPMPSNGLVFVGSSSIRRWEQLTRDFADYNVIQRGIGGALFDDVNYQVNDLVLKYNPRGVVVWVGTNDLASGSDGNEVTADYQAFVNAVHTAQPNVEIFYLGIMPTPGRQGNKPQEDVANANIASIASGDPKQHYIDLPAAFATLNPYAGVDFQNKFVDSIHLNRDGYDFWTTNIRPQIEAVLAPDKVYTPNPNGPRPGDRILFDFGPSNSEDGDHTASPDVNGNYWNNWHAIDGGNNILPGEHLANLVDTTGAGTGVRLTLTAQYESNGKVNGGLLLPNSALLGDLAIGSATEDYFFSTADGVQGGGDDDDGGGFMLDGLDPNLSYNFKFFGSRYTTETRITEYAVVGANSQSVWLTTSGNNIGANGVYDGNDDEIAEVLGVRPDAFGQIFVDMTLIQGSYAYLNAMEVTAVPEPNSLLLMASCVAGLGFAVGRNRSAKSGR